ncbi:MAG: ATP-grasp domain-containing protein [Candidatus Algichlamydia australiensis]|nr:ATP-grasp domain-containing protein [Chlamydiales bacterium]
MSISKTILITGARAPVALDLARLLSASGARVMVAETSKKHLCRFSNAVERSFVVPAPIYSSKHFTNAIIELVKCHQIDVIVPMCEEVFFLAERHSDISSICTLLCDPLSKLEPLHNKEKFIKLLENIGLPFPETVLLTSKNAVKSAAERWKKTVFKPVYSRFARQVVICEGENTAKAESIIPTKSQPWIAQEFIEGRRLCSYGFARNGKLLAHVTYPVEYCVGETGSALAFRSIEHSLSFQFVQNLVKFLNFTGQISLDFIERHDGTLVAIECNPRATSGLHLFNSSDKLPSAMIEGKHVAYLPEGRKGQLLIPLLLLGGIKLKPKKLLNIFFFGRDVIFSLKDILPALFSPLLLIYYALQGYRKNMTITEVSTYDIEWNGGL